MSVDIEVDADFGDDGGDDAADEAYAQEAVMLRNLSVGSLVGRSHNPFFGISSHFEDGLVYAYLEKRRQNLLDCGHVRDLRYDMESGNMDEMISSSHGEDRWREVFCREQNIEETIRETRLLHRVQAESSFSVTATMLGGLSSKMLLSADCDKWSNGFPFAVFTTLMAIVVGFNMVYVVVCAMVHFNIYRILSRTADSKRHINDRLGDFWDHFTLVRSISRDMFLFSIPLFISAVSLRSMLLMPILSSLLAGTSLIMFGSTSIIIALSFMEYTEVYPVDDVVNAWRGFTEEAIRFVRWMTDQVQGTYEEEPPYTRGMHVPSGSRTESLFLMEPLAR